ncbi:MAG: glycosyltransferase family 4 protein [Candidatus Omnitrophota bacterium]
MNILHITNQLDVGGITSYCLALGKGLAGKAHKVFIASSGGELLPRFIASGIAYIPIPIKTKSEVSPKILRSFFLLKKEIKQNNIQIIHAHSRTTQVLGYLLSKKTPAHYVSTCHGFFKPKLFRSMFGCWGEKVIAISPAVKEHLIKDFKVKECDIRLINTGIDMERFGLRPTVYGLQSRKELGLGDEPIIGIIGRLSEEKGHDDLVKAMPQVLKEFPEAKVLIIGEGRTEQKIKKLVKNFKLEKNILFIPSVQDTAKVLEAIDIFVMPSTKEGLGIALMEAQASGCAVIGSRVGGIPSLIKDEENGLLIEPANSSQLAAAILKLLKDKDKRARLGYNARNFIAREFPLEKQVLETERVYQECLNIAK